MKKVMFIILTVLISVFLYYYLTNKQYTLKRLLKKVENQEFYIDNYSILGTHLSISGCIDEVIDNDLFLILKNDDDEIIVDSKFEKYENKTCFYLSDKNNEGINLDELKLGDYLLLVKEKKDSDEVYYTLDNKTEYGDLEYYTITKNNSNNKIDILFNEYKDKSYVEFEIKKEKLPNDVYDITIDPGHGGNDVGSSGKLEGTVYYESDLTLKIALLLKNELEDLGLKVKLTREEDTYLEPYGKGGRALIPNECSSKYSLSLHFNSTTDKMSYGGIEIYTPNDINYEFASYLASNLSKVVGYSKKLTDKVSNGIYYTYSTKSDIKQSNEEMEEKGMEPFDIKEGYPYMYMIREVGGINTGAYIDGRNEYYGLNDYHNSNQTAEPYLLELAYINYNSDLHKVVNNPDEFSKAISTAINEYLNIS